MKEMEDLNDTLCFGDGRAADFHSGVGASSGFDHRLPIERKAEA